MSSSMREGKYLVMNYDTDHDWRHENLCQAQISMSNLSDRGRTE